MRDILVDFGLPAILIICTTVLLACRIDGEVKTILVLAAGWLFRSGYQAIRKKPRHPWTDHPG